MAQDYAANGKHGKNIPLGQYRRRGRATISLTMLLAEENFGTQDLRCRERMPRCVAANSKVFHRHEAIGTKGSLVVAKSRGLLICPLLIIYGKAHKALGTRIRRQPLVAVKFILEG